MPEEGACLLVPSGLLKVVRTEAEGAGVDVASGEGEEKAREGTTTLCHCGDGNGRHGRSLKGLEWGQIEVLAQVGGEKVPDWDVGIHVCTN